MSGLKKLRLGEKEGGKQMIDPENLAIIPPELLKDPVGDDYIDKIIGKCPQCEAGLRAHGGANTGVDITCTNYKCQAGWKSE